MVFSDTLDYAYEKYKFDQNVETILTDKYKSFDNYDCTKSISVPIIANFFFCQKQLLQILFYIFLKFDYSGTLSSV